MNQNTIRSRMLKTRTLWSVVATAALLLASGQAAAQVAARGQALWYNAPGVKNNATIIPCQSCHAGGPTDKQNRTAAAINGAIVGNTGGMGIFNNVLNVGGATAVDLLDLQAFLANPAAVPLARATTSPGAALPFGDQAIATTSIPLTVTLSNASPSAAPFQLAAGAFAITGANASMFAIAAGGTCANSQTLAVGESCTVRVTFTPSGAVGAKNANLELRFATLSVPTISLFLTGNATSTPTPTIALSATSLTFANTPIGVTTAAQTVTLTNTGSAALNFTSFTAGGANPADFARTGTCAVGTPVAAAGGTCTFVYTFTPAAAGSRSASLVIASNNTNGNVTLNVAGSGVNNTPEFLIAAPNPPTLTYNTALGQTSAAQNVTVRNNGGGTLTVSAATASNAAYGVTVPGACAALMNNQTCDIAVTFTPAALGANNATLTITHNAGTAGTVALNGTGATSVPAVAAAPATVNFPLTAVGQQSVGATVVTFTNNGPGTTTLNAVSASAGFALCTTQAACGTAVAAPVCASGINIAQGASCRIGVKFAPAAAGAVTGTLTFASTGTPANATVALNGTGSATAVPELRYVTGGAAMVGPIFGVTKAGETATSIRVTLSNVGTAPMNFLATNALTMTITTGWNPTDFKVEDTTCAISQPLQPSSGTCVVDILFTPAAAGLSTRSAILLVNYSGGASQVPLYGVVEGATGTAPPSTPPPSQPTSPTTPTTPTTPTSPTTPAANDDGGGGAVPLLWLALMGGLLAVRRQREAA